MQHESAVLQRMKHPSIVRFKQLFETERFVFIETEYVAGGQLKQMFQRSLSEGEVRTIMKNILEGVLFIHDLKYVHRDLKPENIMLKRKDSLEVKIVDFGLSARCKVFDEHDLDEKFGTLLYMAPEQAESKVYANKIDMWACGIIMY